jgi:hypothetical protein
MKLLFFILALASTNTFAQMEFDEKIIQKTSMVPVYDLICILPMGDQSRIFTELKRIPTRADLPFEMEHGAPQAQGCNQEAMQSLHRDSAMRFGFVDVDITIIKRTAKNSRILSGKCIRNYQEQVVIDFNYGITLKTSLRGKLIPADDCN